MVETYIRFLTEGNSMQFTRFMVVSSIILWNFQNDTGHSLITVACNIVLTET